MDGNQNDTRRLEVLGRKMLILKKEEDEYILGKYIMLSFHAK